MTHREMSGFGMTTDGLLPVECWCMTEVVLVTPRRLAEGLTHSCGGKNCTRVVATARWAAKRPTGKTGRSISAPIHKRTSVL